MNEFATVKTVAGEVLRLIVSSSSQMELTFPMKTQDDN
jgi:hypothetical protein